ncbi:MAG: UDP-glucose 6-dehydrogenase [Micrococcales bacterium]|nr:MAG: UDP-glucose 6-dehydrogenase [Micrococcales bacterium]PIE28195.1 MAG: UDP-glucose 6-dehydrogenase [Micrococcales bacterium]
MTITTPHAQLAGELDTFGPVLPRLAVLGTGYLGAVHAASMAELGMDVVGVDTDAERLQALAAGKSPFYEPQFDEMLARHTHSGRLSFESDLANALSGADVAFVCVGTPQLRGSNSADLRYVESAVRDVARHTERDILIVGKSTVPVGTAARLRAAVTEVLAQRGRGDLRVEVVWNPEFLREGKAVQDTLTPDRIILGGASAWAEHTMRVVYGQAIAAGIPFISCDLETAELVKVAANAFLATKISFINAIGQLCENSGADVGVLADALGHDVRIGRQFLNAGLGFGGGCLPKDIRALMHRADELGANWAVSLLHQVDEINMWQRQHVIDLAVAVCGGSVLNRRIGVLGAAFKPLTDDVRDSPALNVAAALHLRGAQVSVYDPCAAEPAQRQFPALDYATSTEDAVEGADVVMVLTEWSDFVHADPDRLAALTRHRTVVDARNCLDVQAWRAAGWTVHTLGRDGASHAAQYVDLR